MDISVNGPVDPDCVRFGEEFGFAIRTDEAAEDSVARFDLDWAASVVDGGGDGASAMRADASVEPDAFHCVVQELVVCVGAFDFGPSIDISEVFLASVGKVVIK